MLSSDLKNENNLRNELDIRKLIVIVILSSISNRIDSLSQSRNDFCTTLIYTDAS